MEPSVIFVFLAAVVCWLLLAACIVGAAAERRLGLTISALIGVGTAIQLALWPSGFQQAPPASFAALFLTAGVTATAIVIAYAAGRGLFKKRQ